MAKPTAIKPEEAFARSYADRLILEKLSEMDVAVKLGELADKLSDEGLGLAAVRSLMASNPDVFAFHERRWMPAARLNSIGRPVAEIMRALLDSFGAPVSFNMILTEVARVRQQEVEVLESTVRRFAERDPNFVLLDDDRVAMIKWGFVANEETLERALAINGINKERYEEVKAKLGNLDFRGSNWAVEALKHAPLSLKEISAVAFGSINSDNPRSTLIYNIKDVLRAVFSVPGYVYITDGTLVTEAEAKNLVSSAVKLAQKLTPTIDVDDAQPIELKPEDIAKVVKKVVESEESVTSTKLLEEYFEITPGTKTFIDDFANMNNALRADASVVWVGGDRFRKAGNVPDYIHEIPAPFEFFQSGVLNEENEEEDVDLTDEGLNSSLRKLLQHQEFATLPCVEY